MRHTPLAGKMAGKMAGKVAGTLTGLTALALLGSTAPATAAPPPERAAEEVAERAVAKGLLSPLSLAVASDGTVYYSQNFAGSLHARQPGKKARTIFTAKKRGDEVGAVSERDGVVTFATTGGTGQTTLRQRTAAGRTRTLADLDAFERKRNPDRAVTYGISDLATDCAAQFPADGLPASYGGIVESHPYATATTARAVYVADAAANAVLQVRGGKVSTVAVLPPVPVEVTASVAGAMKLPTCAVGKTYRFEPVPTDVEVARNGDLYVSTLPGGPEDGTMAGHAAVYRIDPDAKRPRARKVIGGLTSATGLAVSPKGTVYVAQLFAGSVVKIAKGSTRARPVRRAMLPGDVEWTPQALLATTAVLTGLEPGTSPAGRVERWRH
ncbi:ScyD/ScyE family protein [Nocardioides sp. W7]|uniref:ScyD/ScyE family protein n=1 Tax=Nocardioides sp. W7 TaxID=2931390 RepID=UPI001FD46049|nr:ScyD/ScyE family protein [Nocardioides sp. W7]